MTNTTSTASTPSLLDGNPKYTWEELLARVGPASDGDRALYALATPKSDLAGLGHRITSEKVLTDFLRWLGTAVDWIDRSSEVPPVLGLSPALVRVMVGEGIALREMVSRRTMDKAAQKAAQGANLGRAEQTFEEGSKRRDQLRAVLATAIAGDVALQAALELAHGSERDHRALSESLRALAMLGRELLADPTTLPARRLLDGGLTQQELASIEDLAERVRSTGDRAKGAMQQTTFTQADVDTLDGTCLTRMRHLRDLFDAAHDLDPSVPKLVPIATRSVFSHPKGASRPPEPPSVPAATVTPEPTATKV